MNFAEHLKAKGLLDVAQVQELYGLGGNKYYLSIRQKEWLEPAVLFAETIAFYKLTEIKNTINMCALADETVRIGNIFDMLKAGTLAITAQGIDYFLLVDPDDDKLIDKIHAELPKCVLAFANDTERESIIKRLAQPLEIQYRADIISRENDALKGFKSNGMQSEAGRLYKALIDAALENRASDMHITPMRDKVKILFRVDGKITPYTYIPGNILDNLKNILCNEAKTAVINPNLPIEGKIVYSFGNQNVDVRLNIIPSKLGFDINLRFLSSQLHGIEDIGYLADEIAQYKALLNMTKGLVVITGPTGSGKTTTLYAGLNDVKNDGRKIMTLEDPVEITLEGITQIDIKKEFGFDYEQGIASTLRHDPDITLIGETRTLDVALESIRLADTGHLTITTMHTPNSIATISRYINLGVSPYALGDTLSAVIAQRLVRRVCPYCGEIYELPQNHYWRDMFNLGDGEIKLVRSHGCAYCDGRGYRGRVAIVEFLKSTEEISAAIGAKANRFEILKIAKAQGFKGMLEDGIKKALLHMTTLDELTQLAQDI